MNVEQTIIHSILDHPQLYKDTNYKYSKEKVLNHLFFTNGNGYEWENGELVCLTEDIEGIDKKIPEDYFNIPIMSEEKDETKFMRDWRIEDGEPFTPYEIKSNTAEHLYPICEYAKIMNLPSNIKKDWLTLAEEVVTMGFEYWHNPYKHANDTYIREWVQKRRYESINKYTVEQLGYLTGAKKRIKQLKEKLHETV